MRTFNPRSPSSALAIAMLLLLCARSGTAQEVIEPTPVQVELTDQAYEAFVASDFAKAARLYRASLDIGPLNITYANHGFALFKLGRCQQAVSSYTAAETAPRVADPTPDEVAATLEDYRSRLTRSCATLRVTCPAGARRFVLDGDTELPCQTDPIWVSSGAHTLASAVGKQRFEAQVELQPGDKGDALLSPIEERLVAGPSDQRNLGTVGVVSGGAGVAALATALILELAVLQPGLDELEATEDRVLFDERRDALSSQQALTQGLLIGGAVFVVGGLALYLLDGDEAPAASTGLQWRLSTEGAGFVW